ncbi:hypothetical protein GGR01_003239 [Acetobacter oeni]|nr:hypothetical protein [Acetobacter oeni]
MKSSSAFSASRVTVNLLVRAMAYEEAQLALSFLDFR